jgi:predicted kinase
MPKLYVLVGVPGSGKTTWVDNQSFDWKRTAYISTDKLVEIHAQSVGLSYSDVFKDYMPDAVKLMVEDAQQAFEENLDIVWDQTSTTVASRARKLRMTPDHYTKIAVVFQTPPADTHAQWLDRPGKEIPTEVIEDMISNFEEPMVHEGFDGIVYVQNQNLVTK